MATMLLGGLWHGAAWTFVIWGGIHGAAQAVEHVFRGKVHIPRWLGWFADLPHRRASRGCSSARPTSASRATCFAQMVEPAARLP